MASKKPRSVAQVETEWRARLSDEERASIPTDDTGRAPSQRERKARDDDRGKTRRRKPLVPAGLVETRFVVTGDPVRGMHYRIAAKGEKAHAIVSHAARPLTKLDAAMRAAAASLATDIGAAASRGMATDETIAAVRAAYRAAHARDVEHVWIDVVIECMADAKKAEVERRASDVAGTSRAHAFKQRRATLRSESGAASVLKRARARLSVYGVELPAHVDAKTIGWLLARFNPGGGGGPGGKMKESSIAKLLASAADLRAAMMR